MGTRPEEVRSEIAATRAELAADVDRLADRTSPARIARRRTERMRSAARSFRERVMGTADRTGTADTRAHQAAHAVREGSQQAAHAVREGSQQVAETVQHGAQQTAEAVRAAPEQAMRRTQGNPLAAGLIAFGVGLLAAALIPRTEAEEQAVGRLREEVGDALDPIREAGRESAQQLGQDAKDVAEQAAQRVRESVGEAADATAERAREQARHVSDQNRGS